MSKKVETIVHLFPDFEEKIGVLFKNDENFRDLCSDYMLCISMIQDRADGIIKNQEELAEFEEIQQNLEEEMLKEILKENANS